MLEMFATNFSFIDAVIVAVYLIGVVLAGVLVNRYVHNAADYIVGGRSAGAALNAASYMGTQLGLVTIMFASIEGFRRGFSYLMLGMISLAVMFFIGKTGFVVRRLRTMRLVTIPEFYEKRFNRKTRVLAGFMCVLAGILNMGLFPKMGATFITYATGLGQTPDQVFMVNLVTSLLIVLVLVYTVMGGMVSVIVTDYIQFIVLSVGMGFGVYVCFAHPDLGWDNIVSTFAQYRGDAAFNPVHSESYGWLYLIWMFVGGITATSIWAPEASRALTAKDPGSAKKTYLLASASQFFRTGAPAFWALGAFCLFQQHSELSAHFFPNGASADIEHASHAMPLFIGKVVPPVLLGVLVAGLMAAFMSTHDSYLLCWASVISRDIISPLRKKGLSDKQQILVTRICIIIIGVFLLIWGIWYELPESVWTYMAVTANIYLCGSAVALIGGMYWSRASSTGAFAAIICGVFSIAGIFLEPIQQVFPWLSAQILGMGNYGLCIIVFVVFSLLFPDDSKQEIKEAV